MLLVAAARKWQRSGSEDDAELPAWMSRIERSSPFQALGVGLLLSCNPKNLALALGAGLSLAQLGAPAGQRAVAIAVFVLVGSTLVIVTVGYALIGGAGARQRLEETKAWLVLHNGAVMAVLFVVFAALLISQGLGLRS